MKASPSDLSRRSFLASLGAVAAAPSVFALGRGQGGMPPLPVVSINHMTISVRDIDRSLQFYQELFGMPIQARQARTLVLQVGNGPAFMAIGGGNENVTPNISHFCLSMNDFDHDEVVSILGDHGVLPMEQGAGGLSGGERRVRIRMRGADFGGDPDGTPELYFGDDDGIVVQLQDATYCGGAGPLGECLTPVEPSPSAGDLRIRDYNHFTVFVTNPDASRTFYTELFGLPVDTYQGALPVMRVGSGNQFLAIAGGPGVTPMIHHACFNIDDFDVDRVLGVLEDHGVSPRADGDTGPAGPMTSYVTMRMEDRGGAPGGTPELYFTDPDGILIQLQDTSYCGGGGYLGDVCGQA